VLTNSSFCTSESSALPVPSTFTASPALTESTEQVPIPTAALSTNTVVSSQNIEGAAEHAAATTALAVPEQVTQIFPCSNPVNPHMRSEATRLQTFRDRSDEWPSHRIAATPERMAQAGLYYLGKIFKKKKHLFVKYL